MNGNAGKKITKIELIILVVGMLAVCGFGYTVLTLYNDAKNEAVSSLPPAPDKYHTSGVELEEQRSVVLQSETLKVTFSLTVIAGQKYRLQIEGITPEPFVNDDLNQFELSSTIHVGDFFVQRAGKRWYVRFNNKEWQVK